MFAIAQAAAGVAVVAIAVVLLIALIRNPMSYVTDAGVTKEGVIFWRPISLVWEDIANVYCRSENDGAVSAITLVASDGRRIDLGNAGGVGFASMYELVEKQLGPAVVHRCDHGLAEKTRTRFQRKRRAASCPPQRRSTSRTSAIPTSLTRL